MRDPCPFCGGTGLKPEPVGLIGEARRIISEVALKHGWTYEEMAEPGRALGPWEARKEAMQRLRAETDLTLESIGRLFGRNHASTINAISGKRR